MTHDRLPNERSISASRNIEDRDYWLDQLAGDWLVSRFPHSPGRLRQIPEDSIDLESVSFQLDPAISARALQIVKGSPHRLFMVLASAVTLLLHKLGRLDDIVVGAPVFKQEAEGTFVNTVLALRSRIDGQKTFKEFLGRMRKTVTEATQHQNYPLDALVYQLDRDEEGRDFPLFDVAMLLDSVHDRSYIDHLPLNTIITFHSHEETLSGAVEYNAALYDRSYMSALTGHVEQLLQTVLFSPDTAIEDIDILANDERQTLLEEFNANDHQPLHGETVSQRFVRMARSNPHRIAVSGGDSGCGLTYRECLSRSSCLAKRLRAYGVTRGSVVAVLEEREAETVVAIFAVLLAGGAYLPINADTPSNRVSVMLEDAGAGWVIARGRALPKFLFATLQGLHTRRVEPIVTAPRPAVADLDQLPVPDRSLVNYNNYHPHLGHAMAKNVLVIQASRGCPYHCAYCHKIWPKTHVFRSARHIFDEVKFHYDLGIRRFAFVDDIFNLAKKNSSEFFQMILEHRMDVQFFFPNGLRGDILTEEFIDLMVEAGTVSLALALETGSARLQKEIAKNLNLERFRRNAEYICRNHPQVITELFTMHGFPGETEEEAAMTLDFIKSLKWIHFPYVNILKVYPGTDMERLALENGISRESILRSENYAHFELSDNLPFERNFTMHYRSELLNNYFLDKERLLHVLPHQMTLLTEDELLQKYNSYLPVHIATFEELLSYLGIDDDELDCAPAPQAEEELDYHRLVSEANRHLRATPGKNALKVLLLDLSQFFRKDSFEQYDVEGEAPIGLMYVMSYLNRELGENVDGKIAKSRIDFDSYPQLKELLDEFQPDLIGVRTLSLLKDFLHQTVSVIKQWLPDIPIVAGGPYATTDYRKALMDSNIDLVVLGEGEITFAEVVEACIVNGNRLPAYDVLATIPGIAFVDRSSLASATGRRVVLTDEGLDDADTGAEADIEPINEPVDPAYVIYTSGSTGTPKGVMIEHRNIEYLVYGLFERVYSRYHRPLNIALVAPFVFDASVKQIFAALLLGHSLYIVPEDVRRDALELLNFYSNYGIDVSDCTPAHLALLTELDNLESHPMPVRRFLVGGEVLGGDLARRYHAAFGEGSVLTNVYGPTECTVDATSYDVTGADVALEGGVPVGRPLPHCRVYVLNPSLQPVPIGIPGELCIAGAGVGRGYLNNPAVTASAFVNDPFCEDGKMYRSGDLARWLPDGNILISGRIDFQVKIRGYRVELEDIRCQCLKHPKVEDAVVVVRGAGDDEPSLAAYVVACTGASLDVADIRDFLAGELPPHMIPPYIVQLEQIPLNRNGKVDRKALPEPRLLKGKRYSSPRHRLDAQLQAIWGDVLGVDEGNVGIDDDFFQLGGHSLKATILVARIHKELRKKIPLQAIFKDPTIRGIAGYLEECGIDSFHSIPVAPDLDYYELAGAQTRLFFLQHMDPSTTAYNLSLLADCKGALDIHRLQNAFGEMIRRHESLRTSFHLVEDKPKQKIHPPMDIALEVVEVEAQDVQPAVRRFITPFDLSKPPLLKAGAVKTGPEEWIVMIMTHHIISDGTSQEIFLRELLALYRGETLPELDLQYKDYCQWQHNPKERRLIAEQGEFWRRHFEGELQPLSLPTDFPRPEDRDYRGRRIRFTIEARLASALKELALAEDATLYMVLMAVFNSFLFCLTGQEDIVVGTPQAGRSHADAQSLIGLLVNTMAIRNLPRGAASFRTLLQDVRTRTRDALANQDYPFEDLVRLVQGDRPPAPGRNPLFDVVLALQNMEMAQIQLPDVTVTPHEYMDPVSRFDLGFFIEEQDDGLLALAEFSSQLFKEETIQRMIGAFIDVIAAVTADPDILLQNIQLSGEKRAGQSAVAHVDFGF